MRRWVLAALAGAMLSGGTSRAAECDLSMFSAKLVENNTGAILISVGLGEKPAVFMIDTGSFWSVIRRRDVGELPLRHAPVAGYGAGGSKFDSYVKIPSFKIGPGDLPNLDFMVVPDEMAADDRIDGVIGANFLHNFDLEIDLANNVVNFFTPSGCGERAVYWPHQSIAAVPLEKDDSRLLHLTMDLDGKPVRTLIDTGASQTILSLAAADDLFDLHSDSPGVEAAGSSRTADGKQLPMFRHQFGLLAIGGIQFLNPWLTLAEDRTWQHMKFGSKPDALILGTHQLRQLHLYIAYKDKILYATASAGPVTGVSAAPAQPAAVMKLDSLDWEVIQPLLDRAQNHLKNRQPDLALADLAEIIGRYPNAALGYVNRGLVEGKTGKPEDAVADFTLAIKIDPTVGDIYAMRGRALKQLHRDAAAQADLDRAIALAPTSAAGLLARARLRLERGDQEGAMADYDQAITLDPKQVGAYRERAALLIKRRDYTRAQADLDQAETLGPADAGVYATRADLQAKQGHYDRAVEEIDRAIALSPASPFIRNNSCWYRALLGQLDAALAECNKALELDQRYATALDSRAFVRMKQNRPADAFVDYDAALTIRPDHAISLYGRGLAKQARGDIKGGKADLVAAQKLQPDVADTYGR